MQQQQSPKTIDAEQRQPQRSSDYLLPTNALIRTLGALVASSNSIRRISLGESDGDSKPLHPNANDCTSTTTASTVTATEKHPIDVDVITCVVCAFESTFVSEGMTPCERCGAALYCSLLCRDWDITSGEHHFAICQPKELSNGAIEHPNDSVAQEASHSAASVTSQSSMDDQDVLQSLIPSSFAPVDESASAARAAAEVVLRTVSPFEAVTPDTTVVASANNLSNKETSFTSKSSGGNSSSSTGSSASMTDNSRISSATKAPSGQLGAFLLAKGPPGASASLSARKHKLAVTSGGGVPNPFVIAMYEEAENSEDDIDDEQTNDNTFADDKSMNISVAMSNDTLLDKTFADDKSMNISVAMSNDTSLDLEASSSNMLNAISEESGVTTEAPNEASWRHNTTSFMSKSTDSSSTIAGSFMDSETTSSNSERSSTAGNDRRAQTEAVAPFLHTPYLDFLQESMSAYCDDHPVDAPELYFPHRRKHASPGRRTAAMNSSQRSHSHSANLGGSSTDFSDESSVDVGSLDLSDDAKSKGSIYGSDGNAARRKSAPPQSSLLRVTRDQSDVPLISPSASGSTSTSTPTPDSTKKTSLKSFRDTYNWSESSSSLSNHLERTTSVCSLHSNNSDVLRRSSLREFRDVYHAAKDEEEIYSLYSDGSKSKQHHNQTTPFTEGDSPTNSEKSGYTLQSEDRPDFPAYTEISKSNAPMDGTSLRDDEVSAGLLESNAVTVDATVFIGDLYETDDESVQQATRVSTRGSIDSTMTTSTVQTQPENPSLQSARLRHEMMRNSLNAALQVYQQMYGEDAANEAFRQLADTLGRPTSKRALTEEEEEDQPGGEETFDWKRPRPKSRQAPDRPTTTSGTSDETSEATVASNGEHPVLLSDQAMPPIIVQRQHGRAARAIKPLLESEATEPLKAADAQPRYMVYRTTLSTSTSASTLMSTSAISKTSNKQACDPSNSMYAETSPSERNDDIQSTVALQLPPKGGYMKYRKSLIKSLSADLGSTSEESHLDVNPGIVNHASTVATTDDENTPVVSPVVLPMFDAVMKTIGIAARSKPSYTQYRVALSQRTLSSCSILTSEGAETRENNAGVSSSWQQQPKPSGNPPVEDVGSSTKRALGSIPGFDETISVHSDSPSWIVTEQPMDESAIMGTRELPRNDIFIGMKVAPIEDELQISERDGISLPREMESKERVHSDLLNGSDSFNVDDDIESGSSSYVETPKPYGEPNSNSPYPSHKKLCYLSIAVGVFFFIGLVILAGFNSEAASNPSEQNTPAPILVPSFPPSVPSPAPYRVDLASSENIPSRQPSLTTTQVPSPLLQSPLQPALGSKPSGPINVMTNFPSSTELSVPSSSTTIEDVGTNMVTEQLFALLIPMSFDAIDILNVGSPQYLAFQWLASYPHLFSNYTIPRIVQRFALVCLYYGSSGDNWSNKTGWLSDTNECTWFTVSVNTTICDPNDVYLNLNLGNNSLSGRIPNELGLLTGLEYLTLSQNTLTGSISSVGSLLRLKTLNLSQNDLTGTIPRSIGLLNLTAVDLSNNFISGSIPSTVGLLTNIVYLDLQANRLSGTLPDELGQLQNATTIKIHNNDIVGVVSDSICLAFHSFTPIFYADCRENNATNAGSAELACPQRSCCTFCCNKEEGCQCAYENTRFDLICTLGKAYP